MTDSGRGRHRSLGTARPRRTTTTCAALVALPSLIVAAVSFLRGEMTSGIGSWDDLTAGAVRPANRNRAPGKGTRHANEDGGTPRPFRVSQCECLRRDRYLALCVSTGEAGPSSGGTGVAGSFYPFAPDRSWDLVSGPDGDRAEPRPVLDGIPEKQLQVLRGSFDNETSVCKEQGSPPPRIAYVEMVPPQVNTGIYHQFLAGMVPQLSFILGLCDGTISVDSERFDPRQIQHWVVNQGNWAKRPNPPYILRAWDRIRPYVARECGDANATLETLVSSDPHPGHRFRWESDPATKITFPNKVKFYVLRPSHARLMREAMFGPPERRDEDARKSPPSHATRLKVALVDRTEEQHRNVVYDSAVVPGASGGRALLRDVVALLNSTRAAARGGTNYSVVETYYTDDFGSEGPDQPDVMKDTDLVLWPHGQQQSNVLWLPECAISIDLLGRKQYVNGYYNAGIQTGHIMGYVYPLPDELDLERDRNQAGLAEWPTDLGSGARAAIRDRPVRVSLGSLAKTLPELLELRSRCLRDGFESLPVPNITEQHLRFVLGRMGDTSSSYRGGR